MSDCILRARALTFLERPTSQDDESSYAFWEDGAVVLAGGRIAWCGSFCDLPEVYKRLPMTDHRPGILMPGFIDTHAHFAQMSVIASYGAQLLDWLHGYTFVQEALFENPAHARAIAASYLDEIIRHGVTTSAVYGTSHTTAMDAFFTEAEARGLCVIAGKVLMDRNAPDALLDTAQSGYDDSKRLIDTWHGRGRLHYAVTPRFAITCSEAQLDLAGALMRETPDVFLQTHLCENHSEIEETARLFPRARDYLDVYESNGLLGPRSLLGHCIHLEPRERSALKESRSVAVFCPTSNLFLGSGLFDYEALTGSGVRVALATDVGAGTSYSMLATASEAYKVSQLRGYSLNPLESFYLLTLGNARALSMEDRIGSLESGSDADLVVIDSQATPAMRTRMQASSSLTDELFVLQTLGDDRCIAATYVAGERLK